LVQHSPVASNSRGMMSTDTNELIIHGKVERFSNSPTGQSLRLIDGKVIWTLDKLLRDFEDDTVCVSVKRVKLECGDSEFV